jgi:hypothetical protein
MSSGYSNPMGLAGILDDLTGSRKFKMAVFKPELKLIDLYISL